MNDEVAQAEVRERIVMAALHVFATYRFPWTTMAMVAERAAVAEKVVRTHFGSKEELYDEVLARALLQIPAPNVLRSCRAQADGNREPDADGLEAHLLTYFLERVQFIRDNAHQLERLIREAIIRPELLRRVLERQQQFYAYFSDFAQHFGEHGELRDDVDTITVLRIALSVAMGYCVARTILLPQAEWNDEDDARLMACVLAHGFRPRQDVPQSRPAPRTKRTIKPQVSKENGARLLDLSGTSASSVTPDALAMLLMAVPSAFRSFLEPLGFPWETANDRLEACLDWFFVYRARMARDNPTRIKRTIQEAILRPATFRRALARQVGNYPRLNQLIHRFQEQGEIRPDIPALSIVRIVLSAIMGYCIVSTLLFPEANWDDGDEAWMMGNVLVNGFRPRRRATSQIQPKAERFKTSSSEAKMKASPPSGREANVRKRASRTKKTSR
ncbi:TetR/AcrR family transcriptional regulator [Pendulispora albinea]|uniref:TetR/AcrR family transcriptional regulator n=1 Tax=Pendulispora albinea TaxID=2741071 RepID=A0ABZ2LQ04_9BACT